MIRDELEEGLKEGLLTGFVNSTHPSKIEFKPTLVLNDPPRRKVLSTIQKELLSCASFDFSVAFLTLGGIASILNCLKETSNKKIRGRILTTDYLCFTQPEALKALEAFPNIEVRMYEAEKDGPFHTKGYIFYKDSERQMADVIVGSANLTEQALSTTREWNIEFSAFSSGELLQKIQLEFECAWNMASIYSEALYKFYSKKYEILHDNSQYVPIPGDGPNFHKKKIEPNAMQEEALCNLRDLRLQNANKALIISATGTGKTYLCAFDVREFNPAKCLYIVHRETILNKSLESFKNVIGNSEGYGVYSGNTKQKDCRFVFSMIQTISRHLSDFERDEFDYIVIDEAHHIQNENNSTYKRILEYFKPKFLLGLTATPERTDSYNIYQDFDNNIAYEIRLSQALEMNLLCPFHYYGVADISVDGIPINDKTAFNQLVSQERVKLIDEKLKFYSMNRKDVRGLIFCSNVKECKFLSEQLNSIGYKTLALSGDDSEELRIEAVKRLEKDKADTDSIDYILTRDIFNEGVDIPSVNQVVMLRPTQSVIVYIQQLGRGLRLHNSKDFLTVIDFIGNYKNNFMIPVALFGDRSFRRDTMEKLMIEGTPLIKGVSTIDFDNISKERVYSAINLSKYSDRAFLKSEYLNVKNMVGRIPRLTDFIACNSVSPLLFIDKYDNYPNFVAKFDKDFSWDEKSKESISLSFVSQIVANGIRPYEGLILSKLVDKQRSSISEIRNEIAKQFGFVPSRESIISACNILSDGFFDKVFREKHLNIQYCILSTDEIISITSEFEKLLTNKKYKENIIDVIAFGFSEYRTNYLTERTENDFSLYKKYTRQDVCRLLNWQKDEHGTVYGYKVHKETKTCPIFVTYNKDSENISATTDYSDRFVSVDIFNWQTRTGTEKIVEEVNEISGMSKLGPIKIPLFITKDTKISDKSISDYNFHIASNGATKHYYVGDVTFVSAKESLRAGKKIFDVVFKMNTVLSSEMFEYFENLKVLKENDLIEMAI